MFAGNRDEAKMEQNCYKAVCRGELHLTLCNREQYLELRH